MLSIPDGFLTNLHGMYTLSYMHLVKPKASSQPHRHPTACIRKGGQHICQSIHNGRHTSVPGTVGGGQSDSELPAAPSPMYPWSSEYS